MSQSETSQSTNQSIEDMEAEASRRPKARSVRPLLSLMPFVLRHPYMLAGALVALVTATTAMLIMPLAVRLMIDNGFSSAGASADGSAEAIDRYFLALLGVAIVLGLASAIRFFFVSWIGERVVADLRRDVYVHITTLSPSFFETTRTGEILSRLTADTVLIKTVIGSSASIALRNLFGFFGSAAMLVYTSPPLSALAALTLPAVVVPMIVVGRLVRRLSRVGQDRIADTSAHAAETISAMYIVQAFTHEATDRAKFTTAVEQSFIAARLRVLARSAMTAIAIVLIFAGVVAILWLGAQYVLDGTMSGGTLGQFIIYAVICAAALGALSEVWGEVQLAAGATERLMELLDATSDISAPANPVALPAKRQGALAFDRVTFHYPSRPHQSALRDFSLRIASGETVALVGPSGAGKSTVFQLLMRFYDPQDGRIALEGVSLDAADPMDLRQGIALVPQETVIFATTVLENIRFGRPDATREDVEAAARAASADGFIETLSDGYDTELGERGVRLSGGQRQRLAIARAILRDAPLLLLDEATSALDAESERLVQDALGRLMDGRTVLVIAHRLATVLKADRIVVMDEGQIVAEGTHSELIEQDGLYAHLAELQFDRAAE